MKQKKIKVIPNEPISLSAARVNAGLTVEQAAERLGITKPTLINYEKGNTSPTVDKLEEICHLYGCRMESISFLPKQTN